MLANRQDGSGQSTWRRRLRLLAMVALGSGGCHQAAMLPTLDGSQPLVVAHRGASGYLPEETLEAYVKAIELGADVIEPDLISTQDGVLIARHDPNLAISTDVASHPEFAGRKKKRSVDGDMQDGFFASDFTLAEIKTLGAISTDAERPQEFNGKYKVPTFAELLDLVIKTRRDTGRTVAIYPESKNPTYHRQLGLPIEDKLLAMLEAAGLNSQTAPVFVQSFEPGSLKYLRDHGLKTKVVQLIDAADVDLKTGELIYAVPSDRPYEWTLAGDKRLYSAMVTAAGLAEIKTYADGIGPWKRYIVSIKGQLAPDGSVIDSNGDGKRNDADAQTTPPTDLVARAHAAGLFVHPYTFRNEKRRLAQDYAGDPKAEFLQFFRLGVDGLFTDFADTALAARTDFLAQPSR